MIHAPSEGHSKTLPGLHTHKLRRGGGHGDLLLLRFTASPQIFLSPLPRSYCNSRSLAWGLSVATPSLCLDLAGGAFNLRLMERGGLAVLLAVGEFWVSSEAADVAAAVVFQSKFPIVACR